MGRLPRSFYEDASPRVARRALGNLLVRVVDGRRLAGVIVETEAYRGSGDPASHAFRGRKQRNAVMFGDPGHAYVYFSMGVHYCLNFTTEPSGIPAAVLVRAVEPVEGMDLMMKFRLLDTEEGLTDGPGKLTRAFGVDATFNGEDLVNSERLFLEEGIPPERISTSPRVGVSAGKELSWRFYVEGNRFVSKARFPPGLPRTHNYASGDRRSRGVVG